MRLYQTAHWCLPVMGAAHASGDLRQCLTVVSLHGSLRSCMCAAMAYCHICVVYTHIFALLCDNQLSWGGPGFCR